jgi:hypothetical protein
MNALCVFLPDESLQGPLLPEQSRFNIMSDILGGESSSTGAGFVLGLKLFTSHSLQQDIKAFTAVQI